MANLWSSHNPLTQYQPTPKIRQWSKEWFSSLSKQQLVDVLKEAKKSFDLASRMQQETASLLWEQRLQHVQSELISRIDPEASELH